MTEPTSDPVPHASSPSPPLGEHDLRVTHGEPISVVVDTNTLLRHTYLRPIAASSKSGDLAVYWSPTIQREIIKVAYREWVLATIRRSAPPPSDMPVALRPVFDRTATVLDAHLSELERRFSYVSNLDVIEDTLLDVISDPHDRPLLQVALAAEAPYLLTLDERHLPHGAIFHGVQCWHPDAFLTLFYQQNPEAYQRVLRALASLPDSISQRLLP